MNTEQLLKEIELEATKSSGAGGQHVNKVATKVQLKWLVEASEALTSEQKEMVFAFAKNIINEAGYLRLSASKSRSQLTNKKAVIQKLFSLLSEALTPKNKRMPTKKPNAAIHKRLKTKKINSELKQSRKKIQ